MRPFYLLIYYYYYYIAQNINNMLAYIAPRLKDKSRIAALKSEAPILQYLIDYGNPQEAQSLNQVSESAPRQRSNMFLQIFKDHQSQKATKSTRKNYSFLDYKHSKQSQDSILPSIQEKRTKRSKMRTMPNELLPFNGQLLNLQCLKPKKQKFSETNQNEQISQTTGNKYNDQLLNNNDSIYGSGVNYCKGGFQNEKSSKGVFNDRIKSILVATEPSENRKVRNIQKVLQKSRVVQDKWLVKLDRFMSLQEPPTQTVQRFMDKVEVFQINEHKQLISEVINNEKTNSLHKYDVLMKYQRDLHKKNLKELVSIRRNFKIELLRLDKRKKINLKQFDKVEKLLDPVLIVPEESAIKREGRNICCPRCS